MSLEAARDRFAVALDGLYDTFGIYPFRADMPCCIPHCFDQSEIDALGAKPLRSLESDDLASFAFSLLLTCGEADDFKHFLPRLLELTATTGLGFVDPELSLGKLQRADWQTWPALERVTVRRYLTAWWRLELESGQDSLEDCFAALCCADNPRVYLDIWRDSSVTQHAVSLAQFVTRNLTMLLLQKNFGTWVGHNSSRIVKNFLLEPATRARLERAFFECDDSDGCVMLSFAEQLLR